MLENGELVLNSIWSAKYTNSEEEKIGDHF